MCGSAKGGWGLGPRLERLPLLASLAQSSPRPPLPRGSPRRWPSGADAGGVEAWAARLLQQLPEPPPLGPPPSPRVERSPMRGGRRWSLVWLPSEWTRVWGLRRTASFPRTRLRASSFESSDEVSAAPPARYRPRPRADSPRAESPRADSPRLLSPSELAGESRCSIVFGAAAASGLRMSRCVPTLSALRAPRPWFSLVRLDAVAGFGSARACPQRQRPSRGPVLLRSYRNPFSWSASLPVGGASRLQRWPSLRLRLGQAPGATISQASGTEHPFVSHMEPASGRGPGDEDIYRSG
jgi:hypothetical protein